MKRGRDRELEWGGAVRLAHTGEYLVQHFQTNFCLTPFRMPFSYRERFTPQTQCILEVLFH